MTLNRQLFNEACDSPVTQRMVSAMVSARIIKRIVGNDDDAGAEVFAHAPDGGIAAVSAEASEMTEDELKAVVGEFPERAMEYNARAWALIDEALDVLSLPPEVVATISGDMIALFACALLAADVREAGRQAEMDDGEQAA